MIFEVFFIWERKNVIFDYMKIQLLLLLSFAITLYSKGQINNNEYLLNNKNSYEVKNEFQFLENEFLNNQLFLFGENHGAAQPHEIDFELFKALYKKANVRHYIAEFDPIKAWMLNNFLEDGNIKWLKNVFKSFIADGLQWANESNMEKYKKLLQFYKTLPKKEKFTIIGIDAIQDYSLVNDYFKYLYKNKNSKIDEINKLISIADTIQYTNRKTLAILARKINTDSLLVNLLKKELKAKFSSFELFLKNAGYVANKMSRDSIMFKTFEDIVLSKNLSDKKMYGFLGFFHTLQTSYEKTNPFGAILKNTSLIKKIVSFQMLAIDCKVLLPFNEQIKAMMPPAYVTKLRKDNPGFPKTEKYIPYSLSNDNSLMKVDGIEELKKITTEKSITFFKLNSSNSPYNNGKKLAEVTGFQTLKMTNLQDVTTDAFQYVILFRNSDYGVPIQ